MTKFTNWMKFKVLWKDLKSFKLVIPENLKPRIVTLLVFFIPCIINIQMMLGAWSNIEIVSSVQLKPISNLPMPDFRICSADTIRGFDKKMFRNHNLPHEEVYQAFVNKFFWEKIKPNSYQMLTPEKVIGKAVQHCTPSYDKDLPLLAELKKSLNESLKWPAEYCYTGVEANVNQTTDVILAFRFKKFTKEVLDNSSSAYRYAEFDEERVWFFHNQKLLTVHKVHELSRYKNIIMPAGVNQILVLFDGINKEEMVVCILRIINVTNISKGLVPIMLEYNPLDIKSALMDLKIEAFFREKKETSVDNLLKDAKKKLMMKNKTNGWYQIDEGFPELFKLDFICRFNLSSNDKMLLAAVKNMKLEDLSLFTRSLYLKSGRLRKMPSFIYRQYNGGFFIVDLVKLLTIKLSDHYQFDWLV